jgi:hypothetical protein
VILPKPPGTVVRVGAGRQTVGPDGKVSKKRGNTYTWLACDVCGEVVEVAGRAPDPARLSDPDYRAEHGRPCRLTPRCPGRHVVGGD